MLVPCLVMAALYDFMVSSKVLLYIDDDHDVGFRPAAWCVHDVGFRPAAWCVGCV